MRAQKRQPAVVSLRPLASWLAGYLHACLCLVPARPAASRGPYVCAPRLLLSCGVAAPRAQELELDVSGSAVLIAQAIAQPSMPRLRLLDLYIGMAGGPGACSFTSLWAAPWLSQLQELSLSTAQGFGSPGLGPLRAAPLLQKLSILTFGNAPALAADDGRALAAAALLELRELHLYNVGPGFVAALAAAPWLGRLEWLMLQAGRDGPAHGLAAANGRALAAAPLPSLKRLTLHDVESGFMAACATAAWLRCLERLVIFSDRGLLSGGGGGGGGGDGDGIPEGASAWTATPFTALVSLALYHGGTAPPSEASQFAALIVAPWFGCLQTVTFRGYPLGSAGGSDGAGLRALAGAPLPSLTALTLIAACLSDADVRCVLSSAPWLAALTSLMLTSNNLLGAPGHRALSRLRLPRLRALSLCECGFDCAGMAALVSAPWLTQLSSLSIQEDSVSQRASVIAAIEDDEWEFGRLRRLGCAVTAHLFYDPADLLAQRRAGE
jgi:hypothetical protein